VTARPDVSTVIPTRDRAGLLARTLRSALSQRGVDLEVIVVDDGSTDDTANVVRSADDPRVRLIDHDRAAGVSTARNSGIEAARGTWIAFLDDDDLWAPTKLARQLRSATDARAIWVYTGAVKIDLADRVVGGTPPPSPREVMARLPRWSLVPGGCSGVIVSRETLARTGDFDPRLTNLADWDLWIRLAQIGAPSSADDPLVGYRLHAGQSSLDVELILREVAILEQKHGVRVDRGSLHHYIAHKCLLSGDRSQAAKHLASAALGGRAAPVIRDVSALIVGRTRRRFPWLPTRPHVDQVEWRRRATWATADESERGIDRQERLPSAPGTPAVEAQEPDEFSDR
jgi:glycosyltransferase involved in cell wall biosynthesis